MRRPVGWKLDESFWMSVESESLENFNILGFSAMERENCGSVQLTWKIDGAVSEMSDQLGNRRLEASCGLAITMDREF